MLLFRIGKWSKMRLNTPIQVTQEFMLKCNKGMNLLNGVHC